MYEDESTDVPYTVGGVLIPGGKWADIEGDDEYGQYLIDIEVLFVNGFAIRIRNQLFFHLILNVLLVFAQDHFHGRFAGTEARKGGFALKFFGDALESFVHLLRFDFHPHQFLARR